MIASLLVVDSTSLQRWTVYDCVNRWYFIVLGDVEHLLASSHGALCCCRGACSGSAKQPILRRCLIKSELSAAVARKLLSRNPQVGQKCVQHVGFPKPCQLRRCLKKPSFYANKAFQLICQFQQPGTVLQVAIGDRAYRIAADVAARSFTGACRKVRPCASASARACPLLSLRCPTGTLQLSSKNRLPPHLAELAKPPMEVSARSHHGLTDIRNASF